MAFVIPCNETSKLVIDTAVEGLEGRILLINPEDRDRVATRCGVRENVIQVVRTMLPEGGPFLGGYWKTKIDGCWEQQMNVLYHDYAYGMIVVEQKRDVEVRLAFPNENRHNRRLLNRLASKLASGPYKWYV